MVEEKNDEQNNPGVTGDQVQPKFFGEDYIQAKKRTVAIKRYGYLIQVLKSDQPLSAIQLSEYLGMSRVTVLSELKKLINLNLVCQIKFEHHVLYCVNGSFNNFIDTALLE